MKKLALIAVAVVAISVPAASTAAPKRSHSSWCQIALARSVTVMNTYNTIVTNQANLTRMLIQEENAYQSGDTFTAGQLAQQVTELSNQSQALLTNLKNSLIPSFVAARSRCHY